MSANPLVADALEVSAGIRDGSWVDAALGGAGGSLDALAVAADPLGSLAAWGVGWLLEHVRPLQQALDWLAGNPAEIAGQAATWQSVSVSAAEVRERLAEAVRTETAEWIGAAGDAYRAHAAEQSAVVEGVAVVAGGISSAVAGAGQVVGFVREVVRDLIGEFVATLAVRLPQWLAAEGLTLGLATPVVIGRVASLVLTWARRIEGFVRALLTSLRQLIGKLDDLGDILRRFGQQSRKLSHADLFSRSGALSNRQVLDQGVGLPRTAEIVQRYTDLAGVDFRGAPVEIVESADDIAYLDFQRAVARTDSFGVQLGPAAFQDEETLVRTLGHESVHVRQHEDGRVTTLTGPLEDEAYAAEDGFVAEWRRNRR